MDQVAEEVYLSPQKNVVSRKVFQEGELIYSWETQNLPEQNAEIIMEKRLYQITRSHGFHKGDDSGKVEIIMDNKKKASQVLISNIRHSIDGIILSQNGYYSLEYS